MSEENGKIPTCFVKFRMQFFLLVSVLILKLQEPFGILKRNSKGKRIGGKEMGGLKTAGRPRRGFMNGGSSTRRGARLTVTGKLALIRKPSVSGGIARRQRYALKMGM